MHFSPDLIKQTPHMSAWHESPSSSHLCTSLPLLSPSLPPLPKLLAAWVTFDASSHALPPSGKFSLFPGNPPPLIATSSKTLPDLHGKLRVASPVAPWSPWDKLHIELSWD